MFSSALVALTLAASALATVSITNPIATSTLTGGQSYTISWRDDGTSPSLAQWGPSSFAIYTGNSIQQTLLQSISNSTDVSQSTSLAFTPDPTVGPNADEYFIRVTSLALPDPTTPQYMIESFSAKFTMSGMTGNFSAAAQAQIDGQSTAPIGGSTAVSSATGSSGPSSAPTTSVSGPSSSAAKTSASSSAKPTTSSNAAVGKHASGMVLVGAGALAALLAL